MECTKVRELLSEYVDGTLNHQAKVIVEEHLTTCKACSEELASLKACIDELGSLKEVKAPDDFLKQVHGRIMRRFEFERMMRKLFVPVKVKLPMELAGAIVTVVLIIFVYNMMRVGERMEYSPAIIEAEKIAEKPRQEEAVKLARKLEDVEVMDAVKRLEPVQKLKEKKPIELTFSLKSGAPSSWSGAATYDKTPGMLKGNEYITQEYSTTEGYTEYNLKTEQYRDRKFAGLAIQAPAKVESKLLKAPEMPGAKKDTLPLYLEDTLSKIKRLAEILEGKVLFVEYEKETAQPKSISVEIPARNYSTFLDKLGSFGELPKIIPSPRIEKETSLRLRINLLPSE